MKYLLDTCVISELVRKNPEKKVVQWIEKQDEENLFLSVLTLGEIQKGISKLLESTKKKQLKEWLNNDLQKQFAGQILPIDYEVVMIWGNLQATAEKRGESIPVVDSLIAATALAEHLTVVTRNDADMKKSGVSLMNPWGH